MRPERIVTLTANPSVDRTLALRGPLERGAVLRVDHITAQAGGKGVNISRAVAAAGVETVAVLPARPDDSFVEELRAAGVECRTSLPAGDIRVNLTITEPDGTTTKLNSPGVVVHEEQLADLATTLVREAARAHWTVLAGSLPPGAPVSLYADLVRRLRGRTRVAVDTSGAPLGALVADLPAAAPDLLKPNAEELASITGAGVDELECDPTAAARAALPLVEQGVGAVLVTLGAQGAVLVQRDGAWHAHPPSTTVVSTVGAGDSSLSGYLLGELRGLPPEQRLALAVAYGSAAASLPGTTIPRPEQVRADVGRVRTLPLPQHT